MSDSLAVVCVVGTVSVTVLGLVSILWNKPLHLRAGPQGIDLSVNRPADVSASEAYAVSFVVINRSNTESSRSTHATSSNAYLKRRASS